MGMHALITENNCLIPGGSPLAWSYVFDFDNEVFTVNGTMHFLLHTIPHDIWPKYLYFPTSDTWGRRNRGEETVLARPTIAKYIGTVDRWENPQVDSVKLNLDYLSLPVLETPP
ncbi:hypothetical protein BDV93DRAFT_528388 [Ceratobasidium sp. AG-I]|nr:hypothetical protein BDV93DRAFT_528388 [Ceratobasidium sp. AG-I]